MNRKGVALPVAAILWIAASPSHAQQFLTLPFAEESIVLTTGWYYGPGALHRGIDYAMPPAEPFEVRAAASGRAIASYSDQGFGEFVLEVHDHLDAVCGRRFSLYAHLRGGDPSVPFKNLVAVKHDIDAGDFSDWKPITRGEFIGMAGKTGWPGDKVHLHYESQCGGYALNKRDPYDIYGTTDEYPAPCGPDRLWADCPPALPPPTPQGFWILTDGPDLSDTVNVTGMAVTAANEIFAVTASFCQNPEALGVFRSFDRGDTWEPINDGLTTTNMGEVVVAASGNIFASAHDGVYRLSASGDSWEHTSLTGPYISLLRATPEALYAADGCFCSGLRRSTDDGVSWMPFGTNLPPCINALVRHWSGDLYAGTGTHGVYRLPYQTTVWQPWNAGLNSLNVTTLATNAAGDLFVGTASGGVSRYLEGAIQWEAINDGLPATNAGVVWASPTQDLYAGIIGNGIFLFDESTESWTERNSGITNVWETPEAFAVDSEGVIYVSIGGLVYRSQ